MTTQKRPSKPRKPELFQRIQTILESARQNIARTVNTTQVMANWLIGREIIEEEQNGKKRAGYGEDLLAYLSSELKEKFGSGYGIDNLELFRRFYQTYPELLRKQEILHAAEKPISDTVRRKSLKAEIKTKIQNAELPENEWKPGILHSSLSWTHYRRLLKINRKEARAFYEIETIKNAWSVRELERQINSFLFDRLQKSKDKNGLLKLAAKGQEILQPIDVLKDPVVLEFLDVPELPRLVESELEQALINNLQKFLLELGKGFAFVSRQERITLDGDHFYIDLVFYHTILKCYVLLDLKTGKLTHNDLGQIQFYVNYFDKERRTEGDNPTLGLVLCPDKNDGVVKYTLGDQLKRNIFTSRYQLYLPTVEELQKELQRELRYLTATQSKQSIKTKPIKKRKG